MQYWMILGALVIVAVVLVAVIVVVIMKGRQQSADMEYDDDEYDDEEEVPRRRRASSGQYDENGDDRAGRRRRKPEEGSRRGRQNEAEGGRRRAQAETDGEPGGQQREAEEGSRETSQEGNEQRPVPNDKSEKKQWRVILENLDTWKKSTFTFYENIGIGRSRSNPQFEKYLALTDDPRVSKVHCAIIREEDKLYVKDLGSRNGTYLNEVRISQPVLIQKDDVIRMGETKIEVKSILREKQKEERESE